MDAALTHRDPERHYTEHTSTINTKAFILALVSFYQTDTKRSSLILRFLFSFISYTLNNLVMNVHQHLIHSTFPWIPNSLTKPTRNLQPKDLFYVFHLNIIFFINFHSTQGSFPKNHRIKLCFCNHLRKSQQSYY